MSYEIENRMSRLEYSHEQHKLEMDRRFSMHESEIKVLKENIIERRRQSDELVDILRDIQEKVYGMQGFSNGVKWAVGCIAAAAGSLLVLILNKLFGTGMT